MTRRPRAGQRAETCGKHVHGAGPDPVGAGQHYQPEDFINDEWASLNQLAWLDARTTSGSWRIAEEFPNLPAWTCKAVGGTTVHWAGCCPRFKEWEFRIRSEHGPIEGANLLDWPIGLSDLEPYYDKAEDRLGVTRTNGIPAPPSNNNFTLNRDVHHQFGQPVPNVHVDDHRNDTAMREHAYTAGESVYGAVDAMRTFRVSPYPTSHNLGTARMCARPQWLDQTSGLTLAFVARRLLAEPVGIVFGAREPGEELRHMAELEIRGVRDSDARALLSSAVRFKLDEAVRDRIVAETRGNPLALLELPRGMTATQLAGGFGLLGAQTLTGRIEESFVRRLELLSDDARRLLLVAAAEPTGDPLLLWRAAELLGLGPADTEAAEAEGLVAIGGRVTFRHPLVRSAMYRSATTEDCRKIHLALAEATDRQTDPDRRAWHLAAAAAGPDEEVALELERSAGRAQARGGLAAAAAFLRRAVTLTSDPARRAVRALAAAQASLQAGEFDAALRLAATAEAGPLDEFQRALVGLLRAQVTFAAGLWSDAPPLLLKAARRLESFDLDLARETYLTAWGAAGLAEDVAARDVLVEICRAVRALPPPPGEPRPRDVMLDGFALLITEGHAAATPTMQRAVLAVADIPVEDVLRWGWMTAGASAAVWDHEGWLASCTRQVQVVRDAGALAALPIHLTYLGMGIVWTGDFAGAASLVAEIDSVAAVTGSRFPPYTLLRLRALQGREGEASAAIASAIEQFGGQGTTALRAYWAAAVLYNGLARYAEAASAARRATIGALNHWIPTWVLPELVEAAAREGDTGLAREALEQLAKTTQPCGTEFALGIEARCRALLSDGAAAEELYREAIERLGRTRLRPELARAHLLYGEWLRRENRRTDARVQLRTAHDTLAAIGMEAFAERARQELAATGEKVRKRTVETRDDLTAQERQIARLARDGLSNPEIGARLFLSPRTVEWHLRNVFTKLGISSRRELANALAGPDSQLIQA